MGLLKSIGRIGTNIGKTVKKAASDTEHQAVRSGHDVGAALDNPAVKAALAAGLVATGVGAPEAALLMAGEGATGNALKKGGNLTQVGEGAARGAVIGGGASLAGSALKAGAGAVANHFSGAPSAPTGPTDTSGMTEDQLYNSIPGGAPTSTGTNAGGGFSLPSVGSALLPKNKDGSIDWGKAAQMGLSIGAGVEGVQNSNKANSYQQKALDAATQDYNAKAPLRQQAYTNLLNPTKPDDSELFDPTNPYSRKLPVVGSAPVPQYTIPPVSPPGSSQAAQLSNVVQRAQALARQKMQQAGVIA